MRLPTFNEAVDIAEKNSAFFHTVTILFDTRVHTFGYRLPGYQDFMQPYEDSPVNALELRGLTFVEKSNNVYHRYLMLRKFFGFNSTIGTTEKDLQDKTVSEVSVKEDGSLIRFVPIAGNVVARSKNSFSGFHCDLANKIAQSNGDLTDFIASTITNNIAAIFELTTVDKPIVVSYANDPGTLRLVQMRDETTGDYVNVRNHPLVIKYNIQTNVLASIPLISDLKKMKATQKNIEGWVVRYSDNTLIKHKTIWYDDFHDWFFEKRVTDKKILEMISNETVDDALSHMGVDHDQYNRVQAINNSVSNFINDQTQQIEVLISKFGNVADPTNRKAFALEHKNNPLLKSVMTLANSQQNTTPYDYVKASIKRYASTEAAATKFIKSIL